MLNIPSPILIFGDVSIAKNTIISAKNRYKNAQWDVVSATTSDLDEIRMISGFNSFGSNDRVILIEDLPNKKAVREFIVDLVKTTDNSVKFIIWDSNEHIKIDPKTKEICKTWVDFYNSIKNIQNSKVIDSGFNFSDKEELNCVKFVQDGFRQFNKSIDDRAAIIFSDIVGKNRGMLYSEIKKLSLNCPDKITEDFIIENTFPSSSEAVLYKFGNAVDSGNVYSAMTVLEEFLSHGVSPYVMAEILLKKARWQLATVSLWCNGVLFNKITDDLMEMGKFPSNVWHSNSNIINKKYSTINCPDLQSKRSYMIENLGLPEYFFNNDEIETDKADKTDRVEKGEAGEIIPMRFMAQQIVDFVRVKIIEKNKKYLVAGQEDNFKTKILDKMIDNYLNVLDKYKEIRYSNKEALYCLNEMIKTIVNFDINVT